MLPDGYVSENKKPSVMYAAQSGLVSPLRRRSDCKRKTRMLNIANKATDARAVSI